MNLQYIHDSNGNKTGVFIPIKEWERLKSFLKELEQEDIAEPTKEEILEGLEEALQQVKQHREGKTNLQSARDLLDEI
jgi:N-glycosylase/DNA lyase